MLRASLYSGLGTVWQKVEAVSNSSEYQHHLDAVGLVCPMPLLKTRLALKEMAAGEVLLVEATDPSSWRDIQKYVGMSAHELIDAHDQDGRFRIFIRKGE